MVFVSGSNPISGQTKVTLPHEEAVKAPFPPGCKVLCFDENGFRVGVVKDVLVFISLHEETTYGTYYEVEIKGANLQVAKTSVFTASDLRLTPDCPVIISPEYFGSVFKNNESEGNIEGVVLGSFEIPPSRCPSSSNDKEHNHIRRFFYSVRVRFPGMDEAVEAHGVPPEHVMVLPSNSETLPASFLGESSIIIGGGSYTEGMLGGDIDFLDERKAKSIRSKPRRVTPEDMHDIHAEEDFGHDESVREGYYQEPYADDFSDESYPESPTRTPARIRNIISNSESHFYDTGSESEIDRQPQILTRQMSNIPSSRGVPNDRTSDDRTSDNSKSRSVSRTRTYVRSLPPVRTKANKIPTHDDGSLTQEYVAFKDQRDSHGNSGRSRRSPTQDNSKFSPRSTDYRDYEENHDMSSNAEGVNDVRSENSDSYGDHNSRNGPMSEEEYDSITFKESDDDFDNDKRESIADPKTLDSNHDETSSVENQAYRAQTPSPRSEIQSNQTASVRSATPVRKKAFGKTWTPTHQNSGKVDESDTTDKPKIGKLHSAARGATPVRIRSSTPVASRTPGTPLSISKLPEAVPKEGCYLLFDSNSGGRFIVQFSRAVVSDAIGFWAPGPGKKLQGFKFKQNQGKSDLMKGVAGKDYKKKYYSGWCQYIKAAKSFNGFFLKYSEREHIDVDVYVFFHETCEIEKVPDSKLFDVSNISAVACVAKGNTTFDGVKTGEYGTFLNKGATAGASLGLL